jgi:hypothetical protein
MRFRFKLTIIIIIILFLVGLYLFGILLPKKIESFCEESVSRYLNRDLKVGDVRVSILKGVILKDVRIFEKDRETPSLTMESISLVPLYLPFILEKKIVIYSVELNNPYLKIVRSSQGKLLEVLDIEKKTTYDEWKVVIKKITVNNLSILFQDEKEGFKKLFSPIDLYLNLAPTLSLNFHLRFYDEGNQKLLLKGSYHIPSKEIQSEITLENIDLRDYQAYFPNIFSTKKAKVKKANLNLEGKEEYRLEGSIFLEDIEGFYQSTSIKGDILIKPLIRWELKKNIMNYQIEGDLINTQIEGIPFIDRLTSVKANFNLNKEKINVDYIEANLLGTKLSAQGSIKNLKDPYLEANINCKTDLSWIKKILHKIKITNLDFLKEGKGNLSLHLEGKVKKAMNYKLGFYLEDITFTQNPDLRASKVKGYFAPQHLLIQEARLLYKGTPIEGDARLDNLPTPNIKMNLVWEGFEARFEGEYKYNILGVDKIEILEVVIHR